VLLRARVAKILFFNVRGQDVRTRVKMLLPLADTCWLAVAGHRSLPALRCVYQPN
jgi:hypothetical protein